MADIPLNSSRSQGLNDTENLLIENTNSVKPSISGGNGLRPSGTKLMHPVEGPDPDIPAAVRSGEVPHKREQIVHSRMDT